MAMLDAALAANELTLRRHQSHKSHGTRDERHFRAADLLEGGAHAAQDQDACAPGRGGGARSREESAPPAMNVVDAPEMTWPVLSLLARCCVHLRNEGGASLNIAPLWVRGARLSQ